MLVIGSPVYCAPDDPAGVGLTKCNVSPRRMPADSLLYFKQFSLVGVHSLTVKNISVSSYSAKYIQHECQTVG